MDRGNLWGKTALFRGTAHIQQAISWKNSIDDGFLSAPEYVNQLMPTEPSNSMVHDPICYSVSGRLFIVMDKEFGSFIESFALHALALDRKSSCLPIAQKTQTKSLCTNVWWLSYPKHTLQTLSSCSLFQLPDLQWTSVIVGATAQSKTIQVLQYCTEYTLELVED